MDETKNDNNIEAASNDNSINKISPNIAAPAQEIINQPPPFQPSQTTLKKEDPGRTVGIIGLVVGIIGIIFPVMPVNVVGLILSIIGYKKSKDVNIKNVLALVGIWLNAIMIVIIFAAAITLIIMFLVWQYK